MATGLYFPFSRCLDQVALKQAVLLYDELLFVDPVSPQARDALYADEARAAHVDPRITAAWIAASQAYELLEQAGIVRTVHSGVLDGQRADVLVAGGLEADRRVSSLFHGRRRWQMLEARVPPSALDGRFQPRFGRASGWLGDPVVEVPYWVGSSVALTQALELAHVNDASLLTDSTPHHELLLRRLAWAGEADQLPGLHASPRSAYRRQQIALRVVDTLAPAAALATMSFNELLVYRHTSANARADLNAWIDDLDAKAAGQPWDPALEVELKAIAAQAAEIAARPGRWGGAAAASKATLSPGKMITDALGMAGMPALAAFVIPHVSLLGALAIGATVAGKTLMVATASAIDVLVKARPAEQNAVAYLLGAGHR